MNVVYILMANYNWQDAKSFSTKDKAIAALYKKRNEMKLRGVEVLKDIDIEFTFLFDLTEHHVCWKIKDVAVE